MGGDNPQQAAALTAEGANYEQMQKALGIATPALRAELAYTRGALAGGEPAYVKQGYAGLLQNIKESSLSSQGADVRAATQGKEGLQALGALGQASGAGAGRGAAAMAEGQLSEGQAQFAQTQGLLAAMSGQGLGALGSAAGISAQQAQAIAHMRNYNPTTASILGVLSAAGSVYGGLSAANTTSTIGSVGAGYGPSGFFG